MPRLNQRGAIHLLVPLILLLGIGVGVYLVVFKGDLNLFSKASNPPIVFKAKDGSALPLNPQGIPVSQVPQVRMDLTSPLGPPKGNTPVSGPVKTYTVTVKYAETPEALTNTPTLEYNHEPFIASWAFSGTGQKFIWAEFQDNTGKTDRRTAQIQIGGSVSGPIPSSTPQPTSTPTPSPRGNRVFVTKDLYTGNLGGLAGADAKCQASANAANLGGTWKAWLSDSKTSASSRLIHGNAPYRLVNGIVIANNWDDLTDGSLINRIDKDQFGGSIDWPAWTGTTASGEIHSRGNCNDWTATTADYTAAIGHHFYLDSQWTAYGYTWCRDSSSFTDREHLYCFEQGATGGPTPTPTPKPTPAPKLPDLVVERITMIGSQRVGRYNDMNVFVRNSGTADSKDTTISVETTAPNGRTKLGVCNASVKKLSKGAQSAVSIKNCKKYTVSGRHTITATVDLANIVLESNEKNNQFSTTVNVTK